MTDREDRITEFRNNIANDRWSKGASELGEEIIAYITDNQAPFPTTLVNVYMWAITEGVCRLFNPFNEWEEADERLLFFITHPKYQQLSLMGHLFNYLALQLRKEYAYPEGVIDKMLEYWQRYQLNEKDLLVGVANRLSGESWMIDGKLSSAGRYLAGALVKNYKGVFRLVSDEQIEHRLLKFMLAHNVALADHVLSDFINIRTDYIGLKYVSWLNVEVLLENNPFKYEPYIMAKLAELDSPEAIHYLTELLIKYLPGKYKTEANRFSFMYLNAAKTLVLQKRSDYRERNIQILDESGKRIGYCFLVCLHSKRILDSSEEVLPYIAELFGAYEAAYLKRELLDLFVTHYKEAFYPYLITEGFKVDPSYEFDGYMKEVFKYLLNIDFDLYKYKLIELCYSKLKKVREVAAVFIAKQGERAIPEATALLNDKKGEIRQTGALILSLIKTDKAKAILLETLDNETNDDARDVMLQSLTGVLSSPENIDEIKVTIEKAAKRSKLSQPLEPWLDEAKLPKLYWLSGEECSAETIRFLFYRQSRAKDIRIDIEAKPLLDFIDKTKSQPFAQALLNAYLNNNVDAKYKFCLTLASMLGDDDEIEVLKNKVVQWSDAGRGKMGEYAVKAIALNGSNKALRAVEFFSRKYKSKYKNIGAAANEAFVLVAEELDIHPYELADSIIPDFGFTGLFKEFEVNGEPYRAFVNNDFKIAFLNEDSKLLKSLPKGTSKELQEEFKEIAKEIKDIVKSQSSRLEQYLVIQRKWTADKWQAFFMGNPVMFAYAIRLIWGVYENNQLLFAFRCQEDQTLINEEGDEIELEEGTEIGIVHPISLTKEQIDYWYENLSDADIVPIFPQLNRPVILLEDSQKLIRMSNEFKGVQYGGYGFVSKMEKLGWNRGSVVDGGGITSYFKEFSGLGITAIIMQEGMIGVGYYDDNAELGSLMFVKNKSVNFGSYVYDEPSKESDERLIPFGEVPPIIYSEVIADMRFFKENDLKKQSN